MLSPGQSVILIKHLSYGVQETVCAYDVSVAGSFD